MANLILSVEPGIIISLVVLIGLLILSVLIIVKFFEIAKNLETLLRYIFSIDSKLGSISKSLKNQEQKNEEIEEEITE